ncbi:CPBP family intramembrane glutamic endopeptidase [Pseudooctadecabacter jejudonensis]|uniref:CAAX amino terminal protease self-immunity n=1 Tax=Pseudooctadecabacter jejudonensis TaxID=1391910 RepID=A0A1Y5S0V1_9RHOB|nr:CPBP family intramembrane glutamic endopeptidase [Pseudooctadecabacter jejudonensis]SLN30080.1 CAAX amino terminal protease self-immunity [Pseudooctadecabacter jejudonensis]
MRILADPFQPTANWVYVIIAMAVLHFGFAIIVTPLVTVWYQSTAVLNDPTLADALIAGSTPAGVRWNLAFFGVYVALLWGLMRMLHGLPLRTLIGPPATAIVAGLKIGLYLIPLYALLVIPAVSGPQVYQNLALVDWVLLLPATLPLLFVQISAEELVFRGYLQSHLAALSRHPLIWMLIPSVLFGLIHYDGTEPAYSAWAYVVWATGLGLVCADVTARHGTLGPALAIHFVNNISALLVVAADDWLYGAALYIWPTFGKPWEPWIPFEALFLLCLWLTARLAIRR